MTDVQEKLLDLLQEIDTACTEENIPYILADRTAAQAAENRGWMWNDTEAHVLVRAADIARLKSALKMHCNRAFEDLSNNADLALNAVRYVNTGTTLIDRDDPVSYVMPGIAVIIHPAFSKKPSGLQQADEKYLRYRNCYKLYDADKITSITRKAMRISRTRERLLGRKGFAKSIYKRISKDSAVGNKLYTIGFERNWISFDADDLIGNSRKDFENCSFRVAKSEKKYLKKYYGKEFDTALDGRRPSSDSVQVISDADLPYDEYLQYCLEHGVDMKALKDSIQEYDRWRSDVFIPTDNKAKNQLAFAKMSVRRIDMWLSMRNDVPKMRELAEAGELDELEQMMAQYIKASNNYLKKKIGFYINDELADWAGRIYEKNGKSEQFKKIMSYVPAVYRQENLEDFLKKEFSKPENSEYNVLDQEY